MGSKKSVELSINVLIIAAIALIVMIIMIAVFTGKVKWFSQDIQSCGVRGGTCQTQCSEGYVEIPNAKCPASKDICCAKFIETA